MCGIFGFFNKRPLQHAVDGLIRLEYRGYDSWGLAYKQQEKPRVRKAANLGRVTNHTIEQGILTQEVGFALAHTRWATNGQPFVHNCHPIWGGPPENPTCLVAHNGVLDNFAQLKEELEGDGYFFQTETDTEAIAHLIDRWLHSTSHPGFFDTEVLDRLEGDYAIAAYLVEQDSILLATHNMPLFVGPRGYFASDSRALAGFENKCERVSDIDRFLWIDKSGVKTDCEDIPCFIHDVGEIIPVVDNNQTSMEKEIAEQGELLTNPLSDWLPAATLGKRFVLFGCGTSYHAAKLGAMFFQRAGLYATACYATEIASWSNFEPDTCFIALTQSGETKDVLKAMNLLQAIDDPVICITNNPLSSAATLACHTLDLQCGEERSVAATKTFTSTVLTLIRMAGISISDFSSLIGPVLEELPHAIDKFAGHLKEQAPVLVLGDDTLYPVAMELALKLKEIALIHAEAMPASEIKHGPLALVEPGMTAIALVDGERQGILSNISEIKARGGNVIALTTSPIEADIEQISLPDGGAAHLNFFVFTIACQWLAFYAAVHKGLSVDHPRNLAKACTV